MNKCVAALTHRQPSIELLVYVAMRATGDDTSCLLMETGTHRSPGLDVGWKTLSKVAGKTAWRGGLSGACLFFFLSLLLNVSSSSLHFIYVGLRLQIVSVELKLAVLFKDSSCLCDSSCAI